MRIIHLVYKLSQGGAEKLIFDITKKLRADGYEISVGVLNNDQDVYSELLEEANVPVLHFGFRRKMDFVAAYKLARAMRNFDIIHVHLFPALYILAFLRYLRLFDNKMIYTEHSTHNKRRNIKLLSHIERFAYRTYDKVVCISEPVKQALEQWVPQAVTTEVIDNAVHVEHYRMALPSRCVIQLRESLPENACLVLMVGALEDRKDQGTLIKAISLLPDDYHLLLVGEGKNCAALQKLGCDLKCSHRVHFMGFRRDVAEIMKACDVYVQSSRWEGFGLVAVEAMAAGLPVVAADVPGLSGVVEGAGVLFPAGDSRLLSAAIQHAFDRKDSLSMAGTKRASLYDMAGYAKEHLDLYSRVLQ